MVSGEGFADLLAAQGFGFATGVPCSMIEDLIRTLEGQVRMPYVPAVREDVAVGLAAGAWLAGRRPVVLMQNSGLGTSMNALASLSLMYGFPALLLVTWRGHAGKDAPEHILTGAISERLFALLGIPHRVLSADGIAEDVAWAVGEMDRRSAPVALLVPPRVFAAPAGHAVAAAPRATPLPRTTADARALTPSISRFAALRAAVKRLGSEPAVHANGYICRESHAVADRPQNFYMIGSMGLASSIALGLAIARPAQPAVVFDGDGNLLMSLGILPMVGALAPRRYVHCVFDNEVYGSTGNQRSPATGVRLDALAAAAGYRTSTIATTEDEVGRAVEAALAGDGPHFVLVKVTPEEADVPRIPHTPAEIRDRFRASLAS